MLAQIDDQLKRGDIDHATHEARRAIVLDKIRKGQAFELDRQEKVRWVIMASLVSVLGLAMLASFVTTDDGSLPGLLVSLALLGYAANRFLHVFRH